ncbi:LysR substrate-binding domain-containing protein [Pseudothauera rhizosphaerae]|uniref:LysR family transcriptional regulator n=1 Tax=Pseudothauera rhizosphaerae TaxID=2565932 RepID=A0A4S4AQT4_9RHOO|nr:LysR substrate-binding domain-containing protein [Pseudothauera rhizosphaerae]THF62129.1 LysR family transcriptional regulator [Pseudothauera rhizosphaerae]
MPSLRKRLPPPNSIVTFESAARHGSFTSASEELRVTQAAVSRQIRRIEDYIGQALFKPAGRGRVLTPAGRELFEAVSIGLGHIAGAVSRIQEKSARSCVTIATPLSFANLWLIPRIASFRRAYPDIEIRFVTTDGDLDPAGAGLPLAVRYGDGKWPHLAVTPFLELEVFPVCTAGYLKECGRLESVDDLLGKTLLDRETENAFAIRWSTWLEAMGAAPEQSPRRLYFNSYETVIRAVLTGQGVALGVDVLLEEHLGQSMLVAPLDCRLRWPQAYYLVSPHGAELTREMCIFADWLLSEARAARSARH